MLNFIRRKSSNIFVPKFTLGIRGSVRSHQTWLDERGLDSGEIVRGTEMKDHNTIHDDLKAYLAYKIGTDTTDQALDDLFTTEVEASEVGNDGIAYNPSTGVIKPFVTTLNSGGDNSETYIEFYGYRTNSGASAYQLAGYLRIGFNLAGGVGTYAFSDVFAEYIVNTSIEVDRRYHFYWKFDFDA